MSPSECHTSIVSFLKKNYLNFYALMSRKIVFAKKKITNEYIHSFGSFIVLRPNFVPLYLPIYISQWNPVVLFNIK